MVIARLLFGVSIITIYPITLLLGRSGSYLNSVERLINHVDCISVILNYLRSSEMLI